MLADHWDGLSWSDVIAWIPVVFPVGSIEMFLDDLFPPRQSVASAHHYVTLPSRFAARYLTAKGRQRKKL